MIDIKRITLPNEVADAIEYLRKDCSVWDDALISNCFNGAYTTSTCLKRKLLGDYALAKPMLTVSALVNGYDRELTVEQRAHKEIREWYDELGRAQVGATQSFARLRIGSGLLLGERSIRLALKSKG